MVSLLSFPSCIFLPSGSHEFQSSDNRVILMSLFKIVGEKWEDRVGNLPHEPFPLGHFVCNFSFPVVKKKL